MNERTTWEWPFEMAILKKAKEHNIPASLSRVQRDKRNICGKLWPTGKPLVVQGE